MKLKSRIRTAINKFLKDDVEEKSIHSDCTVTGLANFLSGSDGYSDCGLSAAAMWSWYKRVLPIRHAVEGIISKNFQDIKPAVFDSKSGEFVESDKSPYAGMMKLLESPNFDVSGREFLNKVAPAHFVTGNIYLMVTAMTEESEPLELFYIAPQAVSPTQGSDGFVNNYMISGTKWNLTFTRKEIGGKVVFVTDDGLKELWHIRNFCPDENNLKGLSPISSSILEIEQYFAGNVHNNATLKNGARPSGILMIPDDVTLEQHQVDGLKAQFRKDLQGSNNAGGIVLAEGGKDFKELSTNNKDMDYIEMMKRNTMGLYLTLGIPLPLVESSSMTFSNYEESRFMLFDMTICPFASMFYAEVDLFLGRRYENDDGQYSLSYDKSKIQALDVRQNQEVDRKIKSGVLTVNESRELMGYEPISEGGDVVLQPSNLIPVGEAIEPSNKDRFVEVMKFTKNADGSRAFSDSEIESKAKELYG